jgi:hypothetical protein
MGTKTKKRSILKKSSAKNSTAKMFNMDNREEAKDNQVYYNQESPPGFPSQEQVSRQQPNPF